MAKLQEISDHFPPLLRDALVEAANVHVSIRVSTINYVIDEAAKNFPEWVLPRTADRPEFRVRGLRARVVIEC